MKLATKLAADVVNTARGAMLRRKRAATRAAKCAAVVGVALRGRREVGESGSAPTSAASS